MGRAFYKKYLEVTNEEDFSFINCNFMGGVFEVKSDDEERIGGEFIVLVYNIPPGNVYKLYINLLTECWDASFQDVDDHPLTNSYPGGESSDYADTLDNHIGIDMCYDNNYAPGVVFALGKYRVNVIEESNPEIALATMTIDYRTSHLPEAGSPDITFHFNASDNKLYKD